MNLGGTGEAFLGLAQKLSRRDLPPFPLLPSFSQAGSSGTLLPRLLGWWQCLAAHTSPSQSLPPAEVGVSPVGLCHLVQHVLLLDDGPFVVEGQEQLLGELLRHQHAPVLVLPALSD